LRRRPVVYLPSAQRDLLESLEYIRKDSPSSAEPWLARIDKTLIRLGSFPFSGSVPKDVRLARLGYRMAAIGEHLAFYVVRPRSVEVRRAVHGKRRYSFLF
jgi:plasmid stabilization system protein ParE